MLNLLITFFPDLSSDPWTYLFFFFDLFLWPSFFLYPWENLYESWALPLSSASQTRYIIQQLISFLVIKTWWKLIEKKLSCSEIEKQTMESGYIKIFVLKCLFTWLSFGPQSNIYLCSIHNLWWSWHLPLFAILDIKSNLFIQSCVDRCVTITQVSQPSFQISLYWSIRPTLL